ncbi:flavoprotein [Mesobacillus maritimus]|uniref:Flavoprotein n=1 Tax=Mesobacillus maritimus TaxID=1643336 RepID=A0ABS7K0H7_9BACI|nr:flavoprotein [Mesobacillus maritimus]MBY0095748.1 flavoprotein [Mesobacillus maritimus]
MGDESFRTFLDSYLDSWRNSSLSDIKKILSKDYKAREISGGEGIDFGYEEAITGWEQGFEFAREKGNRWDLQEVAIIPLRKDEGMAILSATLVIGGKKLETVSLFFQTFKKQENNDWKLIRSYIEAGVPDANLKDIQFNSKKD